MLGRHPFLIAGRKYIEAVRLAGCQPLVVPGATPDEIGPLLDIAHGVLLTGSPSNVHPSHFEQPVHNPALPLDPERDAWTLPLIREVVHRGMPLFAICRGFQEANVALGGSLHQAVHELPGYRDHRGVDELPLEQEYGPAHPVEVLAGGRLDSIVSQPRIDVNSLHGQGVDRLAPGLRIEARAPDGLVEAFSVADAPGFTLCLQWHPEWRAADNPVSVQLFKAFGAAATAYREQRKTP
jgi:putative glutamine amidotransferase